jgi:hypothetical protein
VRFPKLNLKRGFEFAEHLPVYQVVLFNFILTARQGTQVADLKEAWGSRMLGAGGE